MTDAKGISRRLNTPGISCFLPRNRAFNALRTKRSVVIRTPNRTPNFSSPGFNPYNPVATPPGTNDCGYDSVVAQFVAQSPGEHF